MYNARWANEWKQEYDKRNNPQLLGHVLGIVVEIDPIKVSVLDGQAFFMEKI